MASRAQQLLILLVLAFVAVDAVHGCAINIVNSCGYTVTTCAQSGGNAISQYDLGTGQSQNLDFSGSGCTWSAGAVWTSVGGQCAVSGNPKASVDRELADLAEFTITSGSDTYDLSNVNAYTIAMSITVTSALGGSCLSRTCNIPDIGSFCQSPNVLDTEPSGALVCINTDGPNVSAPTPGTEQFHDACPEAFSYTTDTSVQQTCDNGSNYQVTFCPS